MRAYQDYLPFEQEFLLPLSKKRKITTTEKPLSELERWHWDERGQFVGSHFQIIGQHAELIDDRTDPSSFSMSWDQPIYRQPAGTLALFMDEENYLLLKAIFEPGNVGRGYQESGLVLCTSCKFSQGNLAQQKAQGKIPPFSELINDPFIERIISCQAPGDGARMDKQNQHHLCRVSRETLERTYDHLDPSAQESFALVHPIVFKQAYANGLVGEHLRELSSLLLFV